VLPGFLLGAHVLEQPVTRGGTHVEEKTAEGRTKVQLSPGLEEGDDAPEGRGETLATESVREAPELRERTQDFPL
jgi:hypothetical protein